MYAYAHPLDPDTIVLEIRLDETLAIHGAMVGHEQQGDPVDAALSALEAFQAGQPLDKWARPVEQHSVAAPIERAEA